MKDSKSCLDIAAGPGRVTEGLLANLFDEIDLNDLAGEELGPTWDKLEERLSKRKRLKCKIRKRYSCSMTDLPFDAQYDCINMTWAISYLFKSQAIKLLIKAKPSLLRENG